MRVIASPRKLLAKDAWDGNCQCGDEQDSHDGEGEDPLERDGLGEELADTERGAEDGEGESHRVVLDFISVVRKYSSQMT